MWKTISAHGENVRELMAKVARNQSLLVDMLNTTVSRTLDKSYIHVHLFLTVRQGSPVKYFKYREVSAKPSTGHAFVFTTMTAQQGTSGYNASTGKFTASVAGLYFFTVNARVNSGLLRLHIVQDDDPLVASTHYIGSGLQVITNLTSGKQVWVKCMLTTFHCKSIIHYDRGVDFWKTIPHTITWSTRASLFKLVYKWFSEKQWIVPE